MYCLRRTKGALDLLLDNEYGNFSKHGCPWNSTRLLTQNQEWCAFETDVDGSEERSEMSDIVVFTIQIDDASVHRFSISTNQ